MADTTADMMAEPRLTSLAHGGGCGCKLAPNVLADILSEMPLSLGSKDLLVDAGTSDDAAVYKINETTALVATTDFFTPIVDDPHTFGRIAATNALSDVFAMGAKPIFSLAIVGMPVNRISPETIRAILAGGQSVAEACQFYGCMVTGVVLFFFHGAAFCEAGVGGTPERLFVVLA